MASEGLKRTCTFLVRWAILATIHILRCFKYSIPCKTQAIACRHFYPNIIKTLIDISLTPIYNLIQRLISKSNVVYL
jgi:hypothetical protein